MSRARAISILIRIVGYVGLSRSSRVKKSSRVKFESCQLLIKFSDSFVIFLLRYLSQGDVKVAFLRQIKIESSQKPVVVRGSVLQRSSFVGGTNRALTWRRSYPSLDRRLVLFQGSWDEKTNHFRRRRFMLLLVLFISECIAITIGIFYFRWYVGTDRLWR